MQEFRDWKSIPGHSQEKYNLYLCSPEWGAKRAKIRQRSGGICERCKRHPASQCHHMTYLRRYIEPLTDLMDVCEGCHQFSHGWSTKDPAAEDVGGLTQTGIVQDGLVSCPVCCSGNDYVHITGVRVLQGTVMGLITHELVSSLHIERANWRRGSQVEVQFVCECGHHFTWDIQFCKGQTAFEVKDTPGDQIRDDELWRD